MFFIQRFESWRVENEIYNLFLGYGFFVHTFLSAKPWHIFAKISYCFYMFHYFVIMVWQQSWKAVPTMDSYAIAWNFMGIFLATTMIAVITYLFVEMPIAMLWSNVSHILTPAMSAWPLCGQVALKSISWITLFLDQLHDFLLLSLNSFLHTFLKSKFPKKISLRQNNSIFEGRFS